MFRSRARERMSRERGTTAVGAATGAMAVLVLVAVGLFASGALDNEVQPDAAGPTPVSPPSPSPSLSPPPLPIPTPTQPEDLATLYERVRSGVVRLEVDRCERDATGSGALVGPDLVVTAAHVLEGARSVRLLVGDSTVRGEVIGRLPGKDLALIRTSRALDGYVFKVAEATPRIGTDIVALGYPLSGPLSLTGPGIVSTQDESVRYATTDGSQLPVDGLMRTTLLTNPGNSGGPVLDRGGDLVGLVSGRQGSSGSVDPVSGEVNIDDVDGIGYAVQAAEIGPRIADWKADPEQVPAADCARPDEEGQVPAAELVTALLDDPRGGAVVDMFTDYAGGINKEDYALAHSALSPARRQLIPFDNFRQQQSTSVFNDVVLLKITASPSGLVVRTAFTTYQDQAYGPEGLECAFWTLDFRLVPGGTHGWLIDGTSETPGQPQFQACTD